MFPLGAVPIDKEAVKVVCAMQYIRLREDEEMKKLEAVHAVKYKVPPVAGSPAEVQRRNEREAIRKRFAEKELEVLRRASGPFAKIIDG